MRAVYSTVDKSNESEGILTLRVAYTGTTKEAEQARADALQNELQVPLPPFPAPVATSMLDPSGAFTASICRKASDSPPRRPKLGFL